MNRFLVLLASSLLVSVTTFVIAKEKTPAPQGPTAEAKALIKAQMEKAKHIEVADLKKALDAGDKITIIDVRQKSERPIMGLIRKDDMHIPRGFIEVKTYGMVPDRDTPIVAYCGKGIRSAFVANTLKEMGYTNVKNLKGGMKAWNEAGFKKIEISR